MIAVGLQDFSTLLSLDQVQSSEEILDYCHLLATILINQQPLFTGYGSKKQRKAIPLESFDDARIYDLFNRNAKTLIQDEPKWQINWFGHEDDSLSNFYTGGIQRGLVLLNEPKESPLEISKDIYCKVWEQMAIGWVSIDPEKDKKFQKDPEKYYLYTKNRSFSQEDVLICAIAKKFSLQDHLKCYSKSCEENKLYLWIAKRKFTDVLKKFEFQLERPVSNQLPSPQ